MPLSQEPTTKDPARSLGRTIAILVIDAFVGACLSFTVFFYTLCRSGSLLEPFDGSDLVHLALSTGLLWPVVFGLRDTALTARLRRSLGILFFLLNLFLLQLYGYPLWYGRPVIVWIVFTAGYWVVLRPRLRTRTHRLAGPAICILTFLVLLLVSEALLTGASWTFRRNASGRSEKASGDAMRILCVGDSNTYGIGAPKGKSYPDQFAKMLADSGINAEVKNAGIPGANTGQAYRALQSELPDFRPHLVLILVGANNFWNQRDIPPEWLENSIDRKQAVTNQVLGEFQRSRVIRLLTMAIYSIRTGLPIGVPGSIQVREDEGEPDFTRILAARKWDWNEGGEILDSEKGLILRLFSCQAFAVDDFHEMQEWANHRQGNRKEKLRDAWGHIGCFLLSRDVNLVKYARRRFEELLEEYPDSAWSALGLIAANEILRRSESMLPFQEELIASAPNDIRPLLMLTYAQEDDSVIHDLFLGASDKPALGLSKEDIRRMILEYAIKFTRSELYEGILKEADSDRTLLSTESLFVYHLLPLLKTDTPDNEVEDYCRDAARNLKDPWALARIVYHLNFLRFWRPAAQLLDEWMARNDPPPMVLILRLLTLLLTTGSNEKIEEVAAKLTEKIPDHPWTKLAQAYALFSQFKRDREPATAEEALNHAILAARGHAHYDFCYARAINLLTREMQKRFLEETLPYLPCQPKDEHPVPTNVDRVRSLRNGISAMIDLSGRYGARTVVQGYLTDPPNANVLKEVATSHHVLYVSHSAHARKYQSRQRYTEIYAPDGHPNEKGYGLMAADLYADLVKAGYITPSKAILPGASLESQEE